MTRPLSTDRERALRAPIVTSGRTADMARTVRFDRPLVDLPGWADTRLARQIAEVSRTAHEQGFAEGYAKGWGEGRRAAAEREAADLAARNEREEANRIQLLSRAQPLLAALAQAARTLTEQVTPAWDELVDTVLDGAMRLAAAGLARELDAVDAEVLEATRAALRILPSGEPVTLHVNPADIDLLVGAGTEPTDGLRIVPDPAVAVGTVLARTPLHTLPFDTRAGLRAAEEVLKP